MKHLIFSLILCYCYSAIAVSDDDPAYTIPEGTKFFANKDIRILANEDGALVSNSTQDEEKTFCRLEVRVGSNKERVLRAGNYIVATGVYINSPDLSFYMASNNFRRIYCRPYVKSIGDLKNRLLESFKIEFPAPDEIEGKNSY